MAAKLEPTPNCQEMDVKFGFEARSIYLDRKLPITRLKFMRNWRAIPTFDDVVFFDQLMRVRLASLHAKLEAGGPGQSDEPVIEPASLK